MPGFMQSMHVVFTNTSFRERERVYAREIERGDREEEGERQTGGSLADKERQRQRQRKRAAGIQIALDETYPGRNLSCNLNCP